MSGEVSFDLEEGESDSFALFNIWTDETHVNSDDRSQSSIAASFTLIDPLGAGVLDGLTVGRSFIGLYQWGTLVWGEPIDIAFGDGGLLRLGLSDAVFNTGLFGLKEGQRYGDTVYATATYVAAPAVSAVPLPASALLLAGGLAAIGTLRRRKAVA